MKEIFKSFFEVTKERIKNPIIGTFMISWILINWRPIFIAIFSNKSIVERIELIELNYSSVHSYLTIPLVIAFVYVIILPYLMWGIDELMQKSTTGRKKNLTKQIIIDYNGKQQIAIEESKLEDKKASYRDKADFNKQIEQLRNQLDERDKELKEIQEENINLKVVANNSSDSEVENLLNNHTYAKFEESDLINYFKEVGVRIRNNREFPHGINEIIKEKFLVQDIIEEIKEENNHYYQFSKKGLYFWGKYVNSIRISNNFKPSENIDDDLPF
tara:strand:+ start:333 stop:1151 length:819 start_codon:yes stop_codon:yes gene_type:complete